MTLTILTDDDADIKIEYVEPKDEQIVGTVINHTISRAEIITESELRSAGIYFKTDIDIDEDTKQHSATTNNNHDVAIGHFESSDDHQSSLQRTFECNQCSATFIRLNALTRHMLIHADGSKAYTCDYCSKSFSRRNCIRHMKAVHLQKQQKSYECYVCETKYDHLGNLKHHMVLHYEGTSLQCEICSQKFAYQSVLTRHVRSKHETQTHAKRTRMKHQCKECPFKTANLEHFRSHYKSRHTIATFPPTSLISCKICSKTFSTNVNYRQHMRVHFKLFKCTSCPKAFINQYSLDRHSAVHSTSQPTCTICGHQVKQFSTLKRHMRIHSTEKNFKCRICAKAFSLQINLEKHLQRHVIGKKYQCYMCTFSSKTLANLKFHFTKHIGTKAFTCNVCFKRFLEKDVWHSHVSQHISGTFKCDFCPRTYPYAETLRRHTQRHSRSFECTVCSKIHLSKAELQRHTLSRHNTEQTEKTHKCAVCSRMFAEKYNLLKHMRTVHRDRANDEVHRCTHCKFVTHCKKYLINHYKWHTAERTHACTHTDCLKTFKTRACLIKHIKGCHSVEPKIYTCNICSQTFSDRSSRLKHKRVHIVKPIYKCSICSFVAKTEFLLLKVHMNAHTQPFKCNVCSRKFSSKGNLGRHQGTHGLLANGLPDTKIKYECYVCGHLARRENSLRVHFSKHTGAKLFKCNFCTSAFKRPDYLRIHLRIHTGERPFKCDKCSRQFAQRAALRWHLKNVHEKQVKKLNPSCDRKFECFSCQFSTPHVHILIKHCHASHGIQLNSVVTLNKLSTEQ